MDELHAMVPNYGPAQDDETYQSTGTHFPGEPDRSLQAYIVDSMTFTRSGRPILAVSAGSWCGDCADGCSPPACA